MVSAILSRLVMLVFGTLYPAYASYKAVKTKNVHEYVKWMMYWIVFALFCAVETFADVFLSWCPFYYEIKIIFVLWLLSPVTQGSSFIYRKFVHPQLTKREKEIDEVINQAKTKGYSTLMTLGHRGLTYATNIVIKTAIKGQSTLVEHVMKSYSTNDLRVIDSREIDVVDAGAFIDHSDDEFEKRLRDDNHELQGREKQDPIRLQRVLLQRSMGDGADHKHKRIQPTPELSNVEEAEHENSSISQTDPEDAAVTETYEEVIYSPRRSGRYTPREIKSDPYATLPRTRSRQRPRLHDQ